MQVEIDMGQPVITQTDPPNTPKLIADNIVGNWVGLKPPSGKYFTAALGMIAVLSQTDKNTDVNWTAIDSDIYAVNENLRQLRVWAKHKAQVIAFDVAQGTISGTCREVPFNARYRVHGKRLFVSFWID